MAEHEVTVAPHEQLEVDAAHVACSGAGDDEESFAPKALGDQFLEIMRAHFYQRILGIKSVSLLDYVSYVKKDAKDILTKELSWQDYGGKHYESIFTRFYQGYILPQKFGIDKRKAHFSNLICSGQMTKKEALSELNVPPYPKDQQLQDKEYVIKKLDFTEVEFDQVMNLPVRSHVEFGSE